VSLFILFGPDTVLTTRRGFFGRGEMQKEFEDAAFALQPGQVSSIIETASGVHLIER
jgi:parvulin-like peptidyl-prolyl isomerase